MGTSGSGERTAAGKEAHWILQSDRSSAWKAFLASVECRAAGSLPGVAVGGAFGRSPSTVHSYLQALQRKTNDSLGTVDLTFVFILNCNVNSSRLSREAAVDRRDAGGPGRPAGSVDACCNLSFPRKRNKCPNSSLTKMEFCCKEKCRPNSRIWR